MPRRYVQGIALHLQHCVAAPSAQIRGTASGGGCGGIGGTVLPGKDLVVVGHGEVDALEGVEGDDGLFDAGRVWAAGELGEVLEAGVAPPGGVGGLDLQLFVDGLPAVTVHIHAKGFPELDIGARRLNAAVIAVAKLVPKGVSAAHLVIPRNMVEPEKILLRACPDIVDAGTERIIVLQHGGRTVDRPVETEAEGIGTMIVGRQPVRTGARDVAPWFRTIVVLPGKDVM